MQQKSLMKFDPATGELKPYPSQADQWRAFHGKSTAWLFNPWSGNRRSAEDVGSDTFGYLILPPDEPVYAAVSKQLETLSGRYQDLLERLGVNGHDGAIAEIAKLRESAGLLP